MLKAAQQHRVDGDDVIIGTIDTHGRKETAALVEGLEVIPRKGIEYKGTKLVEMDIDAILAGAKACDDITRGIDPLQNPSALLALMWYYIGNGKGTKNMVILPYKDRLELFSKYTQQLIMESLGKEKDLDGKVVNQGIAVFGNKGSSDHKTAHGTGMEQAGDTLQSNFETASAGTVCRRSEARRAHDG